MGPYIGVTRTGQRVHAVVDAPHTLCGTLVKATDPHFSYAELPNLLRCIVCDRSVMARQPEAFGQGPTAITLSDTGTSSTVEHAASAPSPTEGSDR